MSDGGHIIAGRPSSRPKGTADVHYLAHCCIDELNVIIRSIAVRTKSSPLEAVDSILGLKDCLGRLRVLSDSLSQIPCNPQYLPGSGPLVKIARTLLRLARSLLQFGRLLATNNTTLARTAADVASVIAPGEYVQFEAEETIAVMGQAPVSGESKEVSHEEIRASVSRIEDIVDCLWSYKTALALAISDPDNILGPFGSSAAEADVSGGGGGAANRAPSEISNSSTYDSMESDEKLSSKTIEDNPAASKRGLTGLLKNISIKGKQSSPQPDKIEKPSAVAGSQNLAAGHVTWLTKPDEFRETEGDQPQVVKAVIVGYGASGKTCALISYLTNKFPSEYIPTVFDNYATTTAFREKPITLALFDTAGQDDYDRLRPLSYAAVDVFLLSFRVDCLASLWDVQEKWVPEVRHHCPNVPMLLVGLQQDLRNNASAIEKVHRYGESMTTYAEALDTAKHVGANGYVECSALTGAGMQSTFDAAVLLGMGIYHKLGCGKKECQLM